MQLKYIQETLAFISKNGYETNHVKFLKSTAVFLAELFDVNCVLIDKYSTKKPAVTETVVVYFKGTFLPKITYKLENTPCENVINNKVCSYSTNVKSLFPKDELLAQMNVDSYVGIPFWSSKKEPIGLIALMDDKPIIEEKNIETVLGIISIKIEEVLEKMFLESQLNLKIKSLKIAKEVAQENEEKFKKLSNLTFEGILIHEMGIVIDCNASFLKMFGYNREDLVGKDITKIIYPKNYHKIIAENRTKNEILPYEIEGIKKDGTVFPIEIEARNISVKDNKTFRVAAIRDITERKKSEVENKKLSIAIEQSANTIIITDTNGKIEYTNPKFTETTGYTAQEVLGKNPRILKSGAQPKEFYVDLWQTIAAGNIWSGQMKNKAKSGKFYWEQVTITPIKDENGNNLSYLAIKEDITHHKIAEDNLKESEEKYRFLFENNPQPMGIYDLETLSFLEVNNAAIQHYGYTREEFLSITIKDIRPKEDIDALLKDIEIAKRNRYNPESEWLHIKKSGEIINVNIVSHKVTFNNREARHILVNDITSTKKAEKELIIATEEIAKSEKKFRNLFEKSGDAILIIKNGIFTDCNQATLDMLGYKNFEDVLNSHPSKLSPKLQPDGSKSFEKAEELIKITLKKGSHRFEWWHTKSSGEIFPVEVLLTTIENDNNNQVIYCVWRDISNRKHAENELRDAYESIKDRENFVSKILETANEGFWLIDEKANTIDLNAEMCKILGYSETRVKGKSIYDFVDEKNLEIFKNQLEIRKVGESSAYEIELLNANGKNVPCLFKTSPIFNNQNELSGSFALVSDITNIKETLYKVEIQNFELRKLSNELSEKNRLLLESKDRFINLFEQNPIPLWEQDFSKVIRLLNEKKAETKELKIYLEKNPDFVLACIANIKILNANKAALALFGVKNTEELKIHLGKTNTQKAIEVLKKELVSIGSNNKTFSDETELTGKDGSLVFALIKSVIIDDYGISIASVIDITAKRNATKELQKAKEIAEKSENSLNEAQKIAHIGSYELDFYTGIWKSSPALNKIFGIDGKYNRNISGWFAIIHPDDLKMMERYLEKNIIENKEEFNKEYRIIRKTDKQIRWVHGLGKLEMDHKGNLKKMIGTIQDISEKRQFLQDLIIAKEKAEESDRLKTEFIQNMSHEIRTPMNGILGFSELLDNPDLTNEKRKLFIDIIKNSTNQLLHIIDDIMEISVLETKQIKAEVNPVCLNDLLCELFAIFNIKATKKNIKLVLKNELSDHESTILTDKNKLNKVLSNLLENALKFTDEGFVELGYKLNKDSEPDELEIYVKDSGIGIKPEKQELIFDRFSQAEKVLSKKVGGLGLGLSIAKENAELLGGKITVVSELGEGAAFFVTIPYKPINIAAEITKEKEKTSEKKDQYTILIAEDEEVNFMVLETLLVDKIKLPCTIIHAKDGLETVKLTKINPDIGLVLMDIKMPKMDGYEATKKIKEFRSDLPIIAQTAYSSPEEKERAFLAGCDDFMAKPISKDVLKSMLDKYLLADKKTADLL